MCDCGMSFCAIHQGGRFTLLKEGIAEGQTLKVQHTTRVYL